MTNGTPTLQDLPTLSPKHDKNKQIFGPGDEWMDFYGQMAGVLGPPNGTSQSPNIEAILFVDNLPERDKGNLPHQDTTRRHRHPGIITEMNSRYTVNLSP
jgi:hypothetical protein